ncbi:glutaredoxin family protein [Candidatus Peregrinibacteria bacterium]|nr:glutaredoxin family protein [Candidatus Peregrinibacteria bacterium]
MHTFDLYTTPQCGYCKQLKTIMQERKISYSNHDVTISESDVADMQTLTDGGTSVPVLVVDKGTEHQQVAQGLNDAQWLLDHSK